MTQSSKHGVVPSVSNRLAAFLQDEDDAVFTIQGDEFDRLIARENLRIGKFAFFRDLDLMLVILTNRRIISRPLSAYSFLNIAGDDQLADYAISSSGIHWNSLDADLSLRGFLVEEAIQGFGVTPLASLAA
jgi:hypothetical protein